MSRAQQGAVLKQAKGQDTTYNANANTSYNAAQQDVGNYEDQLAKFTASNPYGQGGEFQTSSNKIASNTADANAQATGQMLQSQAVRTGTNAAGAIAATTAAQEANQRQLSAEEANSNQQRIGAEAGYNQTALNASAVPESMEAQLSQQQASAGQGTLNTEESAAQTPSFMDELGQGVIQAGVGVASGFGSGLGSGLAKGCWIAEAIYGEHDVRTHVARLWLNGPFLEKRFGRLVMKMYLRYGQRIAWFVKRSRFLQWLLKPLFDQAVEYGHQAFGSEEVSNGL